MEDRPGILISPRIKVADNLENAPARTGRRSSLAVVGRYARFREKCHRLPHWKFNAIQGELDPGFVESSGPLVRHVDRIVWWIMETDSSFLDGGHPLRRMGRKQDDLDACAFMTGLDDGELRTHKDEAQMFA